MAQYLKYRSLENLKRFLEIITRNELHAAKLEDLNDPTEGTVKFKSSVTEEEKQKFKKEIIEKCYVCSLCKNNGELSGHMFALYADSHKGCCIELNVTAHTCDNYNQTDWQKIDVNYEKSIPVINIIDNNTLKNVLMIKSPAWREENETRFVKVTSSKNPVKLKIKIEKIYLGVKVSKKDAEMYTRMIKGINNDIDVIHLNKSMIKY